ncbi:target of Myb protein 1-like isoform X1 [Astyanax mexicanus]|uniref:Target of Myb protein 1-like isoform X1 n=1 Tax=Astyanax mexicanus TaxID=7994 RepID=A0A8T2KXX1_ASTMX|nr:target of Myb protein 1-like isoform X1 [Astyanax mexicanus]
MEFLIGNPFSTPVGQRIEYATSSSLPSEDWGLNMEICDIVNETEEGPKDAVRAIKKRIVGNRNFREVMFALTVLEACVKNCGHRFHVLVSARDFVEGVLVRTILPKNDPPLVLHDRVLNIIQAWADAFRSSPDLTGVVFVYEDLRRKGLEFPVTELDNCSPIHTPRKSIPDCEFPEAPVSPRHPAQSPQTQAPAQRNADGPITLSPDQVKKLRADLEVVRGNLRVMSEIMTQMNPRQIQQTDSELLQQLYYTCKATQDQVMHLIPRVSEEKLVEQLLVANDDMNATFTRYQSFKRHLNEKTQNSENSCPAYSNLIDLNSAPPSKLHDQSERGTESHTVSSLSNQMAGLSTKEEDSRQKHRNSSAEIQQRDSEENSTILDELAAAHTRLQSAGVDDSLDSNLLGTSPQFNWMVEKGMIPVNQSGVMDDIERWLDVDDDDELADSEGVTSEEFDRFLAERVKAAERLPSVKALSPDHTPSKS